MTELAAAAGGSDSYDRIDAHGSSDELEPADPLELYAEGLDGSAVYLRDAAGHRALLPTPRWVAGLQPGDESLLARCLGPTLDVGCGPGRLVRALRERHTPALGIDVSAPALDLARRSGAAVLQRDVFADVPDAGRWARLLLADGNIGIGGDPVRLLTRCRGLMAPDGLVLAELALPEPVPVAVVRRMRLENESGRVSAWFPWAVVDLGEVRRAAAAAGLRVVGHWRSAGRVFVALAGSRAPVG